MTTYFAGDHHLYHTKILEFGRNQFQTLNEHNEFLIEQHNKIVNDQDIVYFCGDVCLNVTNPSEYSILNRFKGRKRLVIGNHDTPEKLVHYMKYFEKICGYHVIGHKNGREANMIVSHVPLHPSQLDTRFSYNIHAHLHDNVVKNSNGTLDKRYFCVSLDRIEFKPISLDEIRERVKGA